MIPVIVRAPTGEVAFEAKPSSVTVLLIDADGRATAMSKAVPDFDAAKRASVDAINGIEAASIAAVESQRAYRDAESEKLSDAAKSVPAGTKPRKQKKNE